MVSVPSYMTLDGESSKVVSFFQAAILSSASGNVRSAMEKSMIEMPILPQRQTTIYEEVVLGWSAGLPAILKAFDKIVRLFPDARQEECYVVVYECGYDDEPNLYFVFGRVIDNPNYDDEMTSYHKKMAKYHEQRHEEQVLRDEAARQNDEKQRAKAEYKKARRVERLAQRNAQQGKSS